MTVLTDDDRLAAMAYVDGELPPADQAAFDARLAQEPALASAVARERGLRARLQGAYAPVLDEPVPAGLLDLLAMPDESSATPLEPGLDPRRQGLRRPARRLLGREAELHLARVVHRRQDPRDRPQAGRPEGDARRHPACDGLAEPRRPGRLHAEFFPGEPQRKQLGGADDPGARESLRAVARSAAPRGVPARTAATPFSATLLQAVDAMRAGDTLDAAAETSARAKGWKP